ncbi:uncharacterized protein EV420DRAFT_58085 [Desarmillaria tabescens]|uniref:DNA2/NAM7 helicase helicase domain-containing protein n=1 Tax=Armillaria tabescens TaxID=1929756 RepID=A0AA39U335_ARMTA|nr:uncharacterized protein EV420DRAFT_58085 [Desarmillaria tabescens]KAK0469709.1 hypothetical protein EV420DRAFT_58085 [Desarmillaria tabescens]
MTFTYLYIFIPSCATVTLSSEVLVVTPGFDYPYVHFINPVSRNALWTCRYIRNRTDLTLSSNCPFETFICSASWPMLSVAPSFCTFTSLTHRRIAMATSTPKNQPVEIMQNLIVHPNYYGLRIKQLVVKEANITGPLLSIFSANRATGAERADPLGISVGYAKDGKLAALAIADEARCCIIEFNPRSPPSTRPQKMELLQKHIFCRSLGEIYAFDAAQIAMVLWMELGVRVARAVDIQSVFTESDRSSDRKPLVAIQACFGDSEGCKLNEKNIDRAFDDLTYNIDEINRMRVDILERAWISRTLPSHENGISTFSNVKYVDTSGLDEQFLKTLDALARVSEDSRRVGHLKPTTTNHQFSDARSPLLNADGKSFNARASAYKDRFRPSQNVITTIELESGEQIRHHGQTGVVTGMSTQVNFDTSVMNGNRNIVSIISTGREQLTAAEGKRDGVIRRTLQGNFTSFKENPWISNILLWDTIKNDTEQLSPSILEWPEWWFPPRSDIQKPIIQSSDSNPARHSLNRSQQQALDHMLSSDPITLIQGPPGTGKTSVIAAFVQCALAEGKTGIWLILWIGSFWFLKIFAMNGMMIFMRRCYHMLFLPKTSNLSHHRNYKIPEYFSAP